MNREIFDAGNGLYLFDHDTHKVYRLDRRELKKVPTQVVDALMVKLKQEKIIKL